MAMNHCILLMLIFSVGAVVAVTASDVTPSPKAYWNMKFPNIAMPTLLQSMLPNPSGFDYTMAKASFNQNPTIELAGCFNYHKKTTKEQSKNKIFTSMFIRETDLLKTGTVHQLQYLGPSNLGPSFMSRNQVQTKLPFNSKHLSQILATFTIDPTSKAAQVMKSTLSHCEEPKSISHRVCVSSLEEMVDYVSSEFKPSVASKDLQALGTTVTPQMEVSRRYRIVTTKSVGEGKSIISCHKVAFPYGSFMCHNLEGAIAYRVKLESIDNEKVKVNALVGCHRDSSDWSPKYGAFEVLGVGPGQTVCHFLLDNNVIFIKNN